MRLYTLLAFATATMLWTGAASALAVRRSLNRRRSRRAQHRADRFERNHAFGLATRIDDGCDIDIGIEQLR